MGFLKSADADLVGVGGQAELPGADLAGEQLGVADLAGH